MHTKLNSISAKQKPLTHENKFAHDISNRSAIFLKGKDGLDLLQRLSTNEIANLKIGNTAQTILTNEKGKIIDVISVVKLQEDQLLLVGNTTGGEPLLAWLEKYIIMEDATVENITNRHAHFLQYGSEAGFDDVPNSSSDIHTFVEQWGKQVLHHVVCPLSSKEKLIADLQQSGFRVVNDEHFTSFRVEHGIPAHPNELSGTYNPMEAGLIDLISFTKGCYIGQEVIARLDTYKKVQKQLVKFFLGARPVSLPIPIFCGNEEVGTITSVGLDHSNGMTLALGYLKTSLISETKPFFFLKDDQITHVNLRV